LHFLFAGKLISRSENFNKVVTALRWQRVVELNITEETSVKYVIYSRMPIQKFSRKLSEIQIILIEMCYLTSDDLKAGKLENTNLQQKIL